MAAGRQHKPLRMFMGGWNRQAEMSVPPHSQNRKGMAKLDLIAV
jgi:hypothetical protein